MFCGIWCAAIGHGRLARETEVASSPTAGEEALYFALFILEPFDTMPAPRPLASVQKFDCYPCFQMLATVTG